jgi:glutamine amidotransferase
MCIIVVKPAGKTVDKSILENCFANNDDGAGYMYPYEGKVLIQKGFFTFKEFWTSWEKVHARIGDGAPVVFHFRISTSGNLDKTNCHPHRIAGDLAFVHNGILFAVDKKSKVSDTIIYRDRFLSWLVAKNLEQKGIFRLIANHIGRGNEFVFLNGSGKYVICNESSGVWDSGLWYSNATYKNRPMLYAPGFPDRLTWFWDEEWDDFPQEGYCLECGEPLKGDIENALGVCDLCGSEIYGADWGQYRRQAAMSAKEDAFVRRTS